MKRIKILIANKYFLMNYAISCILQKIKGFEVCGTDEDNIKNEIEKQNPDILIIEIELLKTDKYKLLKEIREKFPELKIIVLLDPADEEKLVHVLQFKLEGYLLKNVSRDELIYSANCVFRGERYFSSGFNLYMMEHIAAKKNAVKTENHKSVLSLREREILELIVTGINYTDIAGKLFISEKTVLTHRRNIMKKLKVRNTAQLIVTGIKKGLITIQ